MAHICIFPSSPEVIDGSLFVHGFAYTSTQENSQEEEIPFVATISWTATQAAVNSAVVNAAIAAAENLGHTIGVLDNRILMAGAVGL